MGVIEVRDHVRELCAREGNPFGPCFFEEHLAVVAAFASELAPDLGAFRNTVELAAYLHDLSAVLDPATLPVHAQASADIARRLLTDRNFPEFTIESVAGAIALHAEPVRHGSPEAVCLSNADAAARILRPAYWLYFAFTVRKLPFDEGRRWLRELIERQWIAMVEPARALVGDRYGRTLELIS